MNLLLTLLSLLLIPVTEADGQQAMHADTTVRVMTFNIRYNNPGDGEHAWPHRKARVASVIRFHQAGLVGIQEALKGQVDDLKTLLPEYAWFGVGRDDGQAAGEYAPVFYRKDRFELLEQGTFWLSETPDVPGSRGWDAALPRIATWGRFRDKQAGTMFYLFNTHFDHRGHQARVESARLLINQINARAGTLPIVMTGDFNVDPTTEAYAVLAAGLDDTRIHAGEPPHGPEGTFAGFTVDIGEEGRRIDYIFVRTGIRVLRYGVITDHWNGHFPSDHLPVLAEVMMP